jgi:hypothetical protein
MSLTSSRFDHQILSTAVQKKIAVKDNGEVILLREGHIEVTDLSVMIGQNTYAISNIHSVGVHTYEPKLFLSAFFLLVAFVWSASVALSPMGTYPQTLTVGLVIGLAELIFLMLTTKTRYSVHIKSSEGELNILASNDKNSIGRIANAINRAIFLREFN